MAKRENRRSELPIYLTGTAMVAVAVIALSCAAPLQTSSLLRLQTGETRDSIVVLRKLSRNVVAEVTNAGDRYHLETYPAAIGYSTTVTFGGGASHHVQTDSYAFLFRNDTLIHHDFLFTLHRVDNPTMRHVLNLLRPPQTGVQRKKRTSWPHYIDSSGTQFSESLQRE